MSMISQLRRAGGASKPPIALVYGKPGIGKTTFAASAPGAVFVQTEDGLTNPALSDIPTFGVQSSYEGVMSCFEAIAQNKDEYGFKTVVIDGVDRLIAPLMTQYVCAQNGWATLEDGAYGKGKTALVAEGRNFMDCLIALRNECGLGIIMLAHHKAVRVSPPDSDPYTQYNLAIAEDMARIFIGDSDMVLFATHPVSTSSTDAGFKKKFTRATIDKPRVYTRERGSHIAKNRFDMPEFMPFEWTTVSKYIPAWNGAEQPEHIAAYIAAQPAQPVTDEGDPVDVAETAGEQIGAE